MSTQICPSCHQQQVVAHAQFCPFCGYAFIAASVPGSEYVQPATPYAFTQPQPLAPVIPRSFPAPAPVASRTTSARAVGVTVGVAGLIFIAAYFFWGLIVHPDPTLDTAMTNFVRSSHGVVAGVRLENPLSDAAFFDGYTFFMVLLVDIVPMAVVIAYWFSLRRLYQEWAPSIWFKTFWINLACFVAALGLLGAIADAGYGLSSMRAWALLMLAYYPALLLLVAFASFACAAVGILFGRWFARWPLERIRALHSSSWWDFLLVGLVGVGALALQRVVARYLPIPTIIPLAAIAVAAFACWSALRPLGPRDKWS